MLRIQTLELDPPSRKLYARFVPPTHPLRRVDTALDFSFILPLVGNRYTRDWGRPAVHPERLWRLLFAEYYLKLSDEQIILAAHESLAVRWFARLNRYEQPPHASTLQKFRSHRLDHAVYLAIHAELLRQAREKGLLDPEERQIYDTTHVRSNTRVVSIPRLLLDARAQVIKEVAALDPTFGAELVAQAEADRQTYKADRERRYAEHRPKPTKEEKAASAVRVARRTLQEVRNRLKDGQFKPSPGLHQALSVLQKVITDRRADATERLISVHDLEARKGKKGMGHWDGRKLGVAVQENSRLITGALISAGNRTDDQLLLPLLDQEWACLGQLPPELTADRGLDSLGLRAELQARQITSHIPRQNTRNRTGRTAFSVEDFTYNPEQQTLTCPAGQRANCPTRDSFQRRSGANFAFPAYLCRKCPLKPQCCPNTSPRRGRQVHVNAAWTEHVAAQQHMTSPEFKEAYSRRSRVEAKIWELVYHGARRCRYIGDERSTTQLLMTVTVVNAKRVCTLLEARNRAHAPPSSG